MKNTVKIAKNDDFDRFYIVYDNGKEEDYLHCGDVIELIVNGTWETGRIEYSGQRYLFIGQNITPQYKAQWQGSR